MIGIQITGKPGVPPAGVRLGSQNLNVFIWKKLFPPHHTGVWSVWSCSLTLGDPADDCLSGGYRCVLEVEVGGGGQSLILLI